MIWSIKFTSGYQHGNHDPKIRGEPDEVPRANTNDDEAHA